MALHCRRKDRLVHKGQRARPERPALKDSPEARDRKESPAPRDRRALLARKALRVSKVRPE